MGRKRDRTTLQGRIKTMMKKLWEIQTICDADFYFVVARDDEATVVSSRGGSWPPADLVGSLSEVEPRIVTDRHRKDITLPVASI
jgi:hypothetical protein